VFQGSTDNTIFEDFIKQLLHHCNPFPQPKPVIMMDNASFLHSKRIKQMCQDAGVLLVYLQLYSPELSSIEEFFVPFASASRHHEVIWRLAPVRMVHLLRMRIL
jgi:transposase